MAKTDVRMGGFYVSPALLQRLKERAWLESTSLRGILLKAAEAYLQTPAGAPPAPQRRRRAA
jgi:hypothetical protein